MTIFGKQYGLLESPNNQRLFSDYYLTQRVKEQSEWQSVNVTECRQELITRWAEFKHVANPNESETEDKWIRPILTALGHHYKTQVSLKTPHGIKAPDYVLFGDQSSLQAFPYSTVTEGDFEMALAICEAKKWDRSLDQTSGKERGLSNNPALQADFYMRHSGVTWGILTNGRQWRLYHKETSKHLDIFYEVDLIQILESGNEDAFRYFYLFFRSQAFAATATTKQQTIPWLELILNESRAYEQGVGDNLKEQVYDALRELTQGFLSFGPNGFSAPHSPELLAQIYDNSLIVLYRILFTLYAESRDLLPVSSNLSYASGYSFQALKNRVAHDIDSGVGAVASVDTAWQQLSNLWRVIDEGNVDLGVPVYNGGLFNPKRHPFLTNYRVGDNHLRNAIDLLARVTDKKSKKRDFVDYRDLAVRHLGSIYEGLLEYKVQVADGPLNVDKVKGKEIYTPAESDLMADIKTGEVYLVTDKGERKSTGSYYTPDYIVQYIVEQTLRPILDEVRKRYMVTAPEGDVIRDEAALVQDMLDINVLDPAMGSGHFLVAATDFMAVYMVDLGLIWAEQGDDAKAYWRRRVAQACIYGVDLNKLAVELAKLSMWLTTIAQDRPLSFLDHHLRWGNSLVGARMANVMLDSVPKKRKSRSKKNQPQESQLSLLGDQDFSASIKGATDSMVRIEALAGETLDEVKEAERIFEEEVRTATRLYRQLADVWTARHFGLELNDDAWIQLLQTKMRGSTFSMPAHDRLIMDAEAIGENQRFFHWELEFPEVFFDEDGRLQESAGFDAVIGNPPYVRQEQTKDSKPYFQHAYKEVYSGTADLYVYFYVLGIEWLRPNGLMSFIVTNKWLKAGYGKGIRQYLANNSHISQIIDFGHAPIFADADTFPCIIVGQAKAGSTRNTETLITLFNREALVQNTIEKYVRSRGYFVSSARFGEPPWSLEREEVEQLFRKLRESSVPLAEFIDAAPMYGIKTGFNSAYILTEQQKDIIERSLNSSERLFKPILRGQDIQRWTSDSNKYWMLVIPSSENKKWPWSNEGENAEKIFGDVYPKVYEYLLQWRPQLIKRQDQGRYWWELRSCKYYDTFEKPKIIHTDITWRPQFALSPEPIYLLNTAYMWPTDDLYLLAVVNSPLMWSYMWRNAVHGKDEALRLVHSFVETLPIASPTDEIRKQLESDVAKAIQLTSERKNLTSTVTEWLVSEMGIEKLGQKLSAFSNLSSEEFINEVKKRRGKKSSILSPAELSLLKTTYQDHAIPLQKLQANNNALEQRIATAVNSAYGLTEDEVRWLWKTAPPRMPASPPESL